MPLSYRKVPEEVQATQFTRNNWEAVCKLLDIPYNGPLVCDNVVYGSIKMSIPTVDGIKELQEGDFIIRDSDGTLSVRKPESFKMKYEKL